MSRKLNEIRHNIAKRKQTSRSKLEQNSSILPSKEESHGYIPVSGDEKLGLPKLKPTLLTKLFLSICLFFVSFFIYHSPAPWMKQAQTQVHDWMTEDLPFATVQAWYDSRFKSVFVSSALDRPASHQHDSSETVPVSGLQVDGVTESNGGVHIEVAEEQGVYPVERGTVLFAGTKPETGRTVIIQHEDGQKTVYGNLSEIDVFHYQFVDPNKQIATVKPDELLGRSELFFAIQEGHQYVDPMQVILGD
ncbi:M23 family metallopeptidase [Alkalibacillus aidingensis]|uniref:M23 family metallopeptidase n=1 Tax=Alkalibacillus aidingensis TaxID=2747607 RepID=UPI001660F2DC|nr:M23 family metallopeptidase [Alkalibacillus aidingensis]